MVAGMPVPGHATITLGVQRLRDALLASAWGTGRTTVDIRGYAPDTPTDCIVQQSTTESSLTNWSANSDGALSPHCRR